MGSHPNSTMTGRRPGICLRHWKVRIKGELRRRLKQSSRSVGFTLMELLVSFFLIGLVAVFIHLGYSVGLGARQKAEASLEAWQATQASLDVLSRQIASMASYSSRQEYQGRLVEVLLFQASAHSLGFVTTWSAVSGFAGGLRFVQVFAAHSDRESDSDGAGHRLLLNERPLPPDEALRGSVVRGVTKTKDNRFLVDLDQPRASSDSLILVEGLASMDFRVLAQPQEEKFSLGSRINPRRFRDRFRRAYRSPLPAAIQLSLRWNAQGPWGAQLFEVAVPVGGH